MPQQAPSEHDDLGVPVRGLLSHELEAPVGIGPAAPPALPLPELDQSVHNGLAVAVEDAPDEADRASGHDLVLAIATQPDREERPDRLRRGAARHHSNGVDRRTMSKR